MNKITKNELRQKYRPIRDSFGEEFINVTSKLVCDRLASTQEFINADTILLYYPIKNEISPLPLFEICLKMKKTLAFPVCQKQTSTLIFKEVSSLNDLCQSTWGILEPNHNCKEIIPNKNTLCIVPALAFSRDGHRLGYGKGYYDRFLEKFNGKSMGISYSLLLLNELPHDKHDISVDIIVTESEVLKIANKN